MDGLIEHSKPAANTETVLVTAASGMRLDVVVSCVNTSTTTKDTAWIYLMSSGESLPTATKEIVMKQELGYIQTASPYTKKEKLNSPSFSLDAGESLVVKSTSGHIAFSVIGLERSV